LQPLNATLRSAAKINEQARVPALTAMVILINASRIAMRSTGRRKAHCLDGGESSGEMRIGGRSETDVRTNGAFASLACRQPRYLMWLSRLETGGFASPPYDGFALAVRGQ